LPLEETPAKARQSPNVTTATRSLRTAAILKGATTMIAMNDGTTVSLPAGVREPFEVYVNGVLQRREIDYEIDGTNLRFARSLAKEGRLGPIRWLSMFLGIAGTYRKNDSVDIVYEVEGKRVVATGLPIVPPTEDL
jgi:hypothetical protein